MEHRPQECQNHWQVPIPDGEGSGSHCHSQLFTKVLKLCLCSQLLEEQWVLISDSFDHLKTPKIRTATVPVLQSCSSSLRTAGGPWSLAQGTLASLWEPMWGPKGNGGWEGERTELDIEASP